MIAIAPQSLTQTITQRMPTVITAGISPEILTQSITERRTRLSAFPQPFTQTSLDDVVVQLFSSGLVRFGCHLSHPRLTHAFPTRKC
jgi:hypothetical protein